MKDHAVQESSEIIVKLARLSEGPEVFLSIQGEGPSAGLPSVFVRCSLCNLNCVWCDTDYTWNWVGTDFHHARDAQADYRKFDRQNEIIELSPQEVADSVRKYPQCRNVVLTGGEPLIQQQECADVMTLLRESADYRFEVETNGTIVPARQLDEHVEQYCVSVKLANSGVERSDRERRDALEFFAGAAAYFKFVVEQEQDFDEIETLIDTYGIRSDRVVVMPEGRSSASIRERSKLLIEQCLQRGYRFSDRLHVHLFGDCRGT